MSQFSACGSNPTLADYIDIAGIYPAGRLDKDSEGLLLLTDDGKIQHKLSHPVFGKQKIYWVQVEGLPNETALQNFRQGLDLKDGRTRPAKIRRIEDPRLWERNPPIRFRKTKPTCWLEIRLTEGKNRQVRRMTAHIGYPTLRLVRYAVGDYKLDDLAPGQLRRVS